MFTFNINSLLRSNIIITQYTILVWQYLHLVRYLCERVYGHSHAWTSGLVGPSLLILLNTFSWFIFFAIVIILYIVSFLFYVVNRVCDFIIFFLFHSRNIIVTILNFCAYPTEIVISWKFLMLNWHIQEHTHY